ncbi:hypothetical protein BKI52_31105 [marine bacterium AO1-C]|nr:hypothetical protein BKI52_31105 [marine bacterium AO1-C]
MKSLEIEESYYSPRISFDVRHNEFVISGESYLEHAYEFYKPVINWLEQYLKNNKNPLTIQFQLTYFNTPSSGMIFTILKMLEEYQQAQHIPIKIAWFVSPNNEELLAEGEMFKEDFPTLPFEFKIPTMVA